MREHRRALTLGAVALAAEPRSQPSRSRSRPAGADVHAAIFTRASQLTSTKRSSRAGPHARRHDARPVAREREARARHARRRRRGDRAAHGLARAARRSDAGRSVRRLLVLATDRRIKPDARGQGLSTGQPVGVPSIRLFDLRSGKDTLLANGAASPAVSTSGAIAYPGRRQHVGAAERRVHRPDRRRGLSEREAASLDEPP